MFEKGRSGNPNGRPRGTKNKIDVAALLKSEKCNPFLILADLAKNSNNEHIRCKAAVELASYVAPKLRCIELNNNSENPFSVVLNLSGNGSADIIPRLSREILDTENIYEDSDSERASEF